jgi:hypothetical protein
MIYGLSFNETPSHGYLQVQTDLLERVNFKPSPWSLWSSGMAYLEEDSDMPMFLELLKARGIQYHISYYVRDESFTDMLNNLRNF